LNFLDFLLFGLSSSPPPLSPPPPCLFHTTPHRSPPASLHPSVSPARLYPV